MGMTNIERDHAVRQVTGMTHYPNGEAVSFEKATQAEKDAALQWLREKSPQRDTSERDQIYDVVGRVIGELMTRRDKEIDLRIGPLVGRVAALEGELQSARDLLRSFTAAPETFGTKSFSVNHVDGARTEYTRRTFMPTPGERTEFPKLISGGEG